MTPDARRIAVDALVRIERTEAYANLAWPAILSRTPNLPERDRAFATELVYGVTRMRRACDWLVDRFVTRNVDRRTRVVLRVGAYQLHFLQTPPYAAISTSVALAGRAAKFVEGVLRRAVDSAPDWPDDATRLSYPDWIVERLADDLGRDDALAALEAMNASPDVTERPDGYVQDRASQWVADCVGAQPGDRVADVCAAPGGKATLLAEHGAFVAAGDIRAARAGLVHANAARLGVADVATVVADARKPPYRAASFDRVLVDAPCSGLGVLRRRPDARWRVQPSDVDELAALQRALLNAAAPLVRPGGVLVYSVCTLTDAETVGVDASLPSHEFEPLPPPGEPWQPHGHGARLLPQTAGTDAMFLVRRQRNG